MIEWDYRLYWTLFVFFLIFLWKFVIKNFMIFYFIFTKNWIFWYESALKFINHIKRKGKRKNFKKWWIIIAWSYIWKNKFSVKKKLIKLLCSSFKTEKLTIIYCNGGETILNNSVIQIFLCYFETWNYWRPPEFGRQKHVDANLTFSQKLFWH